MIRWPPGPYRPHRPEVQAFLAEIRAVCQHHGFSIGHEDGHGAFQIHQYDDDIDWLEDAEDCTEDAQEGK